MSTYLCPQGQSWAFQHSMSNAQVPSRHGIHSCYTNVTSLGTSPSVFTQTDYFEGKWNLVEGRDDLFCELKMPLIVACSVNICEYLINQKAIKENPQIFQKSFQWNQKHYQRVKPQPLTRDSTLPMPWEFLTKWLEIWKIKTIESLKVFSTRLSFQQKCSISYNCYESRSCCTKNYLVPWRWSLIEVKWLVQGHIGRYLPFE